MGLGGAGVGCGRKGGALVVVEVVGEMCRGGGRVGGEEQVVGGKGVLGVEGVVEEGWAGSVGEVVPVKVGGVVIAGQD